MDLRQSSMRIDLICAADARHLVRSLEQALQLRGLKVVLRDVADAPRADFGVAVLGNDDSDESIWPKRLAAYQHSAMIAFARRDLPEGEAAFLLPSWPSRRADRMLGDLIDHLSAAVSETGRQGAGRARREGNPWLVLLLLVGLVSAVMFAVTRQSETVRTDSAQAPPPLPVAADAMRATTRGSPAAADAELAAQMEPTQHVWAQHPSVSPPITGSLTDSRPLSCQHVGVPRMPPAHLFSWRPLLRAPERPRIWAQIQLQYYLPVRVHCR